jgi:hypothetical protein
MINPEDLTIIDSRESYTIEEAVAKMLGWMHGPERLKDIQVDVHGLLPSQLPHMYTLPSPLFELIDELKDRARLELFDAADAFGMAEEAEKETLCKIVATKDTAVGEYAELIKKAYFYQSEIKKELNKGALSELKIDKDSSDKNNMTYIRLDSLDDWAKKYGVVIIDVPDKLPNILAHKKMNSVNKSRRQDVLSEELEVILNEMQKPTATKVMAVLRERVGVKGTCITTDDGDGVRYESYDSKVKKLTINALDRRIGTWRKHSLSTG